jgi:hypothetical protein
MVAGRQPARFSLRRKRQSSARCAARHQAVSRRVISTETIAEIQRVAVIDLSTGKLSQVTPENLHIYEFDWSPDGKQIACISGLMSDHGETGGDIYRISSAGGQPTNRTSNRIASPTWIHWFSADSLGFTESADGQSRFSIPNPITGVENKSARVTFPTTIGDGVRQLGLSFPGRVLASLLSN